MSPNPKKKSAPRPTSAPAAKIARPAGPASVERLRRRRFVKTALGAVVGGAVAGPVGAAAGAVITALGTAKTMRRQIKSAAVAKKIPARPRPAVIDIAPKPRAKPRRRRSGVDIYPPIP